MALEVTLRLMPKPERFRTVLAAYDSLERAGQAVAQVVASGLLPGALEIMDRLAIQAAEAAVHAGYPLDAAALLIVELDGEAGQVEEEWRRLRAADPGLGRVPGAGRTRRSGSPAYLEGTQERVFGRGPAQPGLSRQRWGGAAGQAGRRPGRDRASAARRTVCASPTSFTRGTATCTRSSSITAATPAAYRAGRAARGRYPGSLRELRRLHHRRTWHRGGERAYLPKMFSAHDVDTMRHVRLALDPTEISNRGKVFPCGEAPSLSLSGPHPLERAGVISRE